MTYRYYKRTELEEHMLFAPEIARAFGIKTINGKNATTFTTEYLLKWIEDNVEDYETLYYPTRGGMKEVFPAAVYLAAMTELYSKTEIDKLASITINDKVHKIVIVNSRRQEEVS